METDPTAKWVGLFAIISVAVTAMANLIIQIMAKFDAAREARKRKAAEEAAAEAAEEVKATTKVAAEAAASAVKEVKEALEQVNTKTDEKLLGIAKTGKDIHTLVNSNMAVQLKLHAATARRLAAITKDPVDVQAAEMAEKLSAEHMVKQAAVDRDAKP